MNTIPLTSVITSLFTLFYLFLSMRIGYLRGSPVMKLIFNMDKKVPENKLERNVRAHGNFSEYVPLFLILLFISEYFKIITFNYLIILCFIFLYGRIAHAICFAFFELKSSPIIVKLLPLLIISTSYFFATSFKLISRVPQ